MTESARQNVSFDSAGEQAHGYLAVPRSGHGAAVIVIQEWWGLDDHLASIVDRFAEEGFVALAPDLFGGRVTHDSEQAGEMMSSMSVEDAVQKLAGAVDYLLGSEAVTSQTVGAVGFCMGGGFVLMLAAAQGPRVSAAVPFYGVGPAVPESYGGVTAAIQGHYAERDDFYPIEAAQKLEEQIRYESNTEVTFYYYPAGHAFHNDKDLLGTYDPDSAALAWSRAVAFLKQKVV